MTSLTLNDGDLIGNFDLNIDLKNSRKKTKEELELDEDIKKVTEALNNAPVPTKNRVFMDENGGLHYS
jgi:hypothetical protein